LYIAQGLPYGFFTIALPILLRQTGVSLTVISALGFLYLPWALKFLWAPYLDHRGSYKRWLLALQCAALLAAALLSQANLNSSYTVVIVAAFVFNMIAASQDVVTDGLAVRMIGVDERGLANGIQVGAYRVGMILGSGLLLWIFAKFNWPVMFVCMAALLGCTVLPVLFLHEPPRVKPVHAQLASSWLKRALAPGMLAFAGVLVMYRFGDALLSSLLGPFLVDQNLSIETIALMKGTVGSATSLLGAALGAWLTWAAGRRRALLIASLAQAGSFVLYLIAALSPANRELLWVATITEGILGTMATVALFTLMMDASDPEHAGTDYSLLASVIVAINGIAGFAGAFLADATGYAVTFTVAVALTVAGCIGAVLLLDRKPVPARLASAWRSR
jgi:MFS family permease